MMSCKINFNSFKDRDNLAENLSKSIANNLKKSISKNSKASLMVSGGSTPKLLFEKLRNIDINWSKVTIGLCDERWVDPAHKDSNEKFIKTNLLQDRAKEAKFIGMYEKKSIEKAVISCSKRIEENLLPFDVLVLGMGLDAHTASLFPNNSKLKEGLDLNNLNLCVDIEPLEAPHKRMSLTLSSILSANNIYLHFEGESKLKVYNEAMSGDDFIKMPIRSILHQDKKIIEVYYT